MESWVETQDRLEDVDELYLQEDGMILGPQEVEVGDPGKVLIRDGREVVEHLVVNRLGHVLDCQGVDVLGLEDFQLCPRVFVAQLQVVDLILPWPDGDYCPQIQD